VIDNATLDAIAAVGIFRMDYDLSAIVATRASVTGTDILWGTGVHDVDHIIQLMGLYPLGLFKLDIGPGGKDSSWLQATIDDMQRFRTLFVARWGEVNKVSDWNGEWTP